MREDFHFAREYKPFSDRKFRVDFAFLPQKIAVEVEGEGHKIRVTGKWVPGRHLRSAGFRADIEKYNRLALEGWKLIRVTAAMIKSGAAIIVIEKALKG